MRLRVARIAILGMIGCGGPSSPSMGDAPGGDADADTSDLDTDLDGIPDVVDVCPDVGDPAQVDMDQDGLGWMCDPVESFTAEAVGFEVTGSVFRDTAVGISTTTCASTVDCEYTIVAAGRDGSMTFTNTSSDPAFAWAALGQFTRPLVTAEQRVLVAGRAYPAAGTTYELDLASKQATPRGTGTIDVVVRDGRGWPLATLLAPNLFGGFGSLVEPRSSGELAVVSGAPGWFWWDLDGKTVVASDSVMVVPRYNYHAENYDVQGFTPGDASLHALSPPVVGTGVSFFGGYRGAPWCAVIGGFATIFEQTPDGWRTTTLPQGQCRSIQRFASRTSRLWSGTAPVSGYVFAAERNGQVETITSGASPQVTRYRTFGDETSILVLDPGQIGAPSTVWAVPPTGAPVLLATDLANVSVSVVGEVAHVAGTRSTPTTGGALVAIRYRPGQAPQTVVVAPGPTSMKTYVVTTASGAVFVTSDVRTWFAPSATMTFALNLELFPTASGGILGAARGANTVLFTGAGDESASTGAVFAYDEPGGTPRLTRLTQDATNFSAWLIDPDPSLPRSEYFGYGTATSCSIGRLVAAGSAPPALEVLPCLDKFQTVIAQRRDGTLVVGDRRFGRVPRELIALGPNGSELLALASGGMIALTEQSTFPPTLAGWVAVGTTTAGGQVCLDESPRRCWATPQGASPIETFVELPTAASPGYVSTLLHGRQGSTNRFTVVRSIGPGDLP